ncbi:MAG: elongation factor G, partial [Desulfobulbaceae bacterium]|nr:elongation factor G [Desulfobulbaceae bacterium]
IAFINKMDRIGADFERVIDMMVDRLGANPLPVQIPVGSEDQFQGVIDLILEKMLVFDKESQGLNVIEKPIPSDFIDQVTAARMALIEKLADFDERVMEKYLEEQPISASEIIQAIRLATLRLELVPVFCGSAFKNKGVQPLLNAVISYLPSPMDVPAIKGINKDGKIEVRETNEKEKLCVLAFKLTTDPFVGNLAYLRVYSGVLKAGDKIYNPSKRKKEKIARIVRMHANKREELKQVGPGDIAAVVGLKFTTTGDTLCQAGDNLRLDTMDFPEPVISTAIEPKGVTDEEKLRESLAKIAIEDPSFRTTADPDTGQILISGMGELHLEIITDRLVREFKVGVNVGKPQVAYKETFEGTAKAEGKFDQHTVGKGQYGHVWLEFRPMARGSGFEFENCVDEEIVPAEFITAVKKAVVAGLDSGPL